MAYSVNDIEKVMGFKTWSSKEKVDALLRIDANMYCNLGKESSKQEKAEVKRNSKAIYQAIKKLDKESGEMFLRCQDYKT
jgi:hypothetical protein